MKTQALTSKLGALFILLLFSGAAAFAQRPVVVEFSGLVNDYSPPTVKGGPWEMHGQWSLEINGWTGRADFSAAMTMSGYGKTASGGVDATQPGQGAHTHNIRLTNATVIWNMDGCPAYAPPTKNGFQIQGTVSLITGNGSNSPFETVPPSSTLQVCVSGGDEIPYSVPYSNVTMVFGGPAVTHFGPQAIHGVVRRVQLEGFGR